jgi:hypothetical protein
MYPGFTAFFFSDCCFFPRKHRLAQRASILARNIVAILLIPPGAGQWIKLATTGLLLTVAGQPVIFTRFLFKSSAYALLTLLCKEK